MEKKFTKGEWKVSNLGTVHASPVRNIVHSSKEVAVISDFNRNEDRSTETKANATLIAAAPQLLHSAEYNRDAWNKILEIIPDPECMDYDPGDILMQIESVANRNIHHTSSAIQNATKCD